MTGVATLLRYIAIAMVVAALSVSASAQVGYSAVRDFLRGHVAQAQQLDQQPPAQPPERLPGESKAKISKADAKDLFRSVDEIARWVSDETGLKVEHEIKRQLSSRADLQTYLEEKMRTDEGSERLKRAEVVLKKFGMLPPDFDMAPFLLRLLREQIVGFYDPGKKTIYLLDWVDLRDQKPVLAHELTHALQDQAVGLEKWLRAAQPQKHETQNSADRNLAEAASDIKPQKKRGKEELTFDPDQDERQAARDAVAEGQGMVAMLDYELQSSNRTALNSPQMIQDTFDRMVTARDSPIFTSAPLYLKEVLTFPYRYGMKFELEVLSHGGRKLAFAGVLQSPPACTRQIMEPKTYLQHEELPRLGAPDFKELFGDDYKMFDSGSMGELDVQILIEHFAKQGTAARLAHAWRGGYYVATVRKHSVNEPGATDAEAPPTAADLGLIYFSRWASPKEATDFARIYAESLPRKYKNATAIDSESLSLAHQEKWSSEAGQITITTSGNKVLVLESFLPADATRIHNAVFRAASAERKELAPR